MVAVAGRQAAGLRPVGRRRRLADVRVRDRRHRQRSRGRSEVDAVLGSLVDAGLARASSTRAIPEPPKGKVLEAALSGQALYYHRVGTPQSEDRLIYERKDLPTWFVSGTVDRRRPLSARHRRPRDPTTTTASTTPTSASRRRPNISAPVKPLVEDDDAEFAPIRKQGIGAVSAIRSAARRTARSSRSISTTRRKTRGRPWSPSTRSTRLKTCAVIGGRIVAQYLADVQSRLALFDLDGAARGRDRASRAPARSTVSADARMSRKSSMPSRLPLYPTAVFRYDPVSNSSVTVRSGQGDGRRQPVRNDTSALRHRKTARRCRFS